MKNNNNNFQRNTHPFNQFEGFASFTSIGEGHSPLREQLAKEGIGEMLKRWDHAVLLSQLLASIAIRKTAQLARKDQFIAIEEKINRLVDRDGLRLLIYSMTDGSTQLSEREFQQCKKTARQLTDLSQNCWHFKDSIVYILNSNFELRKQIFTLQVQLAALRQSVTPDDHSLNEMVLPGKILQNDHRVNWSYLREQHGIVLDEPIAHYHFAILQLINKYIIAPNGKSFAIKDLLNTTRELFKTSNDLQETETMVIE